MVATVVAPPGRGGRYQYAARVHGLPFVRYFNNQLSTAREYVAAVMFSYKLHLGWEVPTSHCLIVAVGKGIVRIRGGVGKKAQVWLPLTWPILAQGYLLHCLRV